MREVKRIHYIFHGSVQGVGFRYHAYHAANSLGLTGYVRNLYDGTVEAEVQGQSAAIQEFLRMLYDGRYIRIDDIDVKNISVKDDERCFQIMH